MTETRKTAPRIGQVLRERRQYHGWTLADLAERTGVSKSTLSKIENDQISPSYQSIIQLCAGLGIEIGDLVVPSGAAKSEPRALTGRRSISYAGSGLTLGDSHFTYTYLCTEIAHKRIVPMVIDIAVHAIHDLEGLWTYPGEEFLYVLEGEIELHTEFYETARLGAGDAVYFDSTMGHAYIAAGDRPAKVLAACSSATPNLAQTLREEVARRLVQRHKPGRA
jgi:transcriptional regulator with XRE-family HTH domain